MKFSTALFAVAAAATAARAVPAPQAQDGGHGTPPVATLTPAPHESSESAPAPAPSETAAGPTTEPIPATSTGPNGRPDHKIPYATNNALFDLQPKEDTWRSIEATGALNGTVHIAVNHQDKAVATFSAPQTYSALEVWSFQRADGGVISVIIDGKAEGRIDLWNRTVGANDVPVLLFQKDLERKTHVVEFRNLEDPRTKKFGQFNIDRVYITTEEDAEPDLGGGAQAPPDNEPTAPTTPTTPPAVPTPKPEAPLPLTASEETGQQTTKPSGALALAAPKLLSAGLAVLVAAAVALF